MRGESSVRPLFDKGVRMELAPLEEGAMDDQVDIEHFGNTNLGEDITFDEESGEAIKPSVVRDPGAPNEREIEEHSITHLPHRSWCPICVESRSRDRPHRSRRPRRARNSGCAV